MSLPLLETLAFALALGNADVRAAVDPADFQNDDLRKLVTALKRGRNKVVTEWFAKLGVSSNGTLANGLLKRLKDDAEFERVNGVLREHLEWMVKEREKGPVLPLLEDGWRYSWWDGCQVWKSFIHEGKWQALIVQDGEPKVIRDGRGRIRLFPSAMAAARELERRKVGPGRWRELLDDRQAGETT